MSGKITHTRAVGDDGEWVLTPHYFLEGKEVTQAEYLAALPEGTGEGVAISTAYQNAKPWKSQALAVHRKQIPAVMARNAKHGLHIPYDRLGRPVCTDAGQRRKLMQIEKVVQMNSFYGS